MFILICANYVIWNISMSLFVTSSTLNASHPSPSIPEKKIAILIQIPTHKSTFKAWKKFSIKLVVDLYSRAKSIYTKI